jgi:hypothetical protein
MALWGIAYALGPNYNKPWDAFTPAERESNLRLAKDALVTAEQKAASAGATPCEKALIHATQVRYPEERTGDDYMKWNVDYARAMEEVYRQFGDDLDVAALYADALMNITPWALCKLRERSISMARKRGNVLDLTSSLQGTCGRANPPRDLAH